MCKTLDFLCEKILNWQQDIVGDFMLKAIGFFVMLCGVVGDVCSASAAQTCVIVCEVDFRVNGVMKSCKETESQVDRCAQVSVKKPAKSPRISYQEDELQVDRGVQVSVKRFAQANPMVCQWDIGGLQSPLAECSLQTLFARCSIAGLFRPIQSKALDDALEQLYDGFRSQKSDFFVNRGQFTLKPKGGWLWWTGPVREISKEAQVAGSIRLQFRLGKGRDAYRFILEGFPAYKAGGPWWLRADSD